MDKYPRWILKYRDLELVITSKVPVVYIKLVPALQVITKLASKQINYILTISIFVCFSLFLHFYHLPVLSAEYKLLSLYILVFIACVQNQTSSITSTAPCAFLGCCLTKYLSHGFTSNTIFLGISFRIMLSVTLCELWGIVFTYVVINKTLALFSHAN